MMTKLSKASGVCYTNCAKERHKSHGYLYYAVRNVIVLDFTDFLRLWQSISNLVLK